MGERFLVYQKKGRRKRMYYPTLEELKRLEKDKGNLVPIYRDIAADMDTPVSAYLKINRGGYSFLLESVEGAERLARYSFIGTDPYRVLITRNEDNVNPLPLLAAELNQYRLVPIPNLPRFCSGAVGYLSYEVAAYFEALPSPANDPLGLPESIFMFTDTILVFDHVTHKIRVLSHVRLNGDDIERSYTEAVDKIETLVARLKQPLPEARAQPSHHITGSRCVSSNFTEEQFEACVTKAKEYIASGEVIQVVLSQRFTRPTNAKPFEIYRALRSLNPSPYMFFLDFQDFHLLGASPEILVRVEDGTVMTRPLAGTRPRGKDPTEDIRLEQELRTDEKERAEHIMLVDLGRNDIGRVSEPGTVVIDRLMEVERYSHVMHLVTHVQGKLRHDLTPFHALEACFPAGTVAGAPKVRAMEIIAELEPDKRGPYAGAVGYFSFSGNMDMAITIRSMVVKDGVAHVQAGCGVVYDSIPEREFAETINKAKALLEAIDVAEQAQGEMDTSDTAY
jgi:anthranilate synthase component 1